MNWNLKSIINPIIKLNWLGWHTDTLTLQNNNWIIAIEKDVRYQSIRFIIKHKEFRISGFSAMIKYSEFNEISAGVYLRDIMIPIQYLATNELRIYVTNFDPSRFQVIDAEPQMIDTIDYIDYDLNGLDIFRSISESSLEATKEILVEPENVDRLLDKILEMQSPQQKEIRQRYLKDKKIVNYQAKQVYAQIMSIAA